MSQLRLKQDCVATYVVWKAVCVRIDNEFIFSDSRWAQEQKWLRQSLLWYRPLQIMTVTDYLYTFLWQPAESAEFGPIAHRLHTHRQPSVIMVISCTIAVMIGVEGGGGEIFRWSTHIHDCISYVHTIRVCSACSARAIAEIIAWLLNFEKKDQFISDVHSHSRCRSSSFIYCTLVQTLIDSTYLCRS